METVKESGDKGYPLLNNYLSYVKWRKLAMALGILFMVISYSVSIINKMKEVAKKLIHLMMLFLIIDRAVGLGYIVQIYMDLMNNSPPTTKNDQENRDVVIFMIVCKVIFLCSLLYGVLK